MLREHNIVATRWVKHAGFNFQVVISASVQHVVVSLGNHLVLDMDIDSDPEKEGRIF